MIGNAQQWIDALQLGPHPEGGWYREVYRAEETISRESLPSRFSSDRRFSTAIYFLLQGGEFSAFHRIRQDELWHFYDGTSLTIHQIDPAGQYTAAPLGRDLAAGERPLVVAPAGWLFGATLNEADSFALVGCTVAPGFDFADFEMPSRGQLLRRYPRHRAIIERLTK